MSSTTDIYTVYQIKNLVNSKVYIGITTKENPIDRWNEHIVYSKYNQTILSKAIRKYGSENFEFSIIEQTNDLERLKELEAQYIQEYNSYCFQDASNGYNMTLGGDGAFGYKLTEEQKQKISESVSGINHPMYGKRHSYEAKLKMSKAKIGKKQTEDSIRKNKESKIGVKHHFWGKFFSEEHKRKLSESHKGKTHSEETKKKMSEAAKSRKRKT